MPNPNPAKPRSLSDHVHDVLLERITNGTLKSGERLVEMQIARELDTSQAPVREALRRLQSTGLVEIRPNRGAIVRKLDAAGLRDVYAVRAELEGMAADLVARNSPSVADELGALCDRMEMCVDANDISGLSETNAQFHRAIVVHSSNSTLLDLWESLDIRARSALNLIRNDRDLGRVMQQHREITDAVSRANPDEARAAIRHHILDVLPPEPGSV